MNLLLEGKSIKHGYTFKEKEVKEGKGNPVFNNMYVRAKSL